MKQMIWKEIAELDLDDVSMRDIINQLNEYDETYGKENLKFRLCERDYSDNNYIGVFHHRLETDVEYEVRLDRERHYAEKAAQREKAQLEDLIKKHGLPEKFKV